VGVVSWDDVVAFADRYQPAARAIECPRCKAPPYAACSIGGGYLITPNGEMHRDRVEASAGKPWPTLRTPTETRDHIATFGAVKRALEEIGDLVRAHPRLAAEWAAAIRNCPHAIAAMGRALAHGEREGGEAGSNRGQTAQNHAEHAMSHGATAYGRPEERDAVTGELDATHAAARWALLVEVQR
jgi:hypothetical protein